MTFRLTKVLKGYQPVHCLPDTVILWRRGVLYRADPGLTSFEPICELPTRSRLLTRFAPQLVARILRFGIRSSVMLDADTLLVAQRGTIFRVSLATGQWSVDLEIPDNRRLLALSVVERGGQRVACFGEYFHNVAGAEVAIWRRSPGRDGSWSRTVSFAPGAIDHVHNIVQTPDGMVWILTGDHDAGAAIWRSNFALDKISRFAAGKQSYRACWLWQSPRGAKHYATDSHLEPNHLLSFRDDAGSIAKRAPVAGSSIYAGTAETYVAFSSSVEPGEPSGKLLRDFTERKPGPGISGNAAVIYKLDDDGLSEVLSAPMDGWPLRLAQFATFSFPGGTMPADRFYAFGRAVRKYDGACLMFERAA